MISPRRAVAKSLLGTQSQELAAERVEELRTVKNPVKRKALLALNSAVMRRADFASSLFGLKVPELVGRGWHSDVYRVSDDEVVKVQKPSRYLSKREKERLADRMRYEHDALCSYLGPVVLPHTISVGADPVDPNTNVVLFNQPFKELDYIDLVNGSVKTIARRIKIARASYPDAVSDLDFLVTQSQLLSDECRLSTDIKGDDNVGFDSTTGRLTITDSQPVNDEVPDLQAVIALGFKKTQTALTRIPT